VPPARQVRFFPSIVLRKSDGPEIDPAKLKQAHVVVTSYSIVASEHGVFKPDAKNEGKAKGKSKATKKQETSDSDTDSDSDSEDFSKTLGVKKKRLAFKKQVKDVLFHVKWFSMSDVSVFITRSWVCRKRAVGLTSHLDRRWIDEQG
jgi:hypothetical protein